MAKAVKQVETDVQTVRQLVEQIGSEFSLVWHALDGNTQAQAALGIAWDKVKQLQHVTQELDALLSGAEAAVIEIGRQRDIAVYDASTWRKHGDELARRILAGHIAVMGNIPVVDVMRVLDVLSGKKNTLEEPRLQSLLEEIQDMANALLEEQVWNAASRED